MANYRTETQHGYTEPYRIMEQKPNGKWRKLKSYATQHTAEHAWQTLMATGELPTASEAQRLRWRNREEVDQFKPNDPGHDLPTITADEYNAHRKFFVYIAGQWRFAQGEQEKLPALTPEVMMRHEAEDRNTQAVPPPWLYLHNGLWRRKP